MKEKAGIAGLGWAWLCGSVDVCSFQLEYVATTTTPATAFGHQNTRVQTDDTELNCLCAWVGFEVCGWVQQVSTTCQVPAKLFVIVSPRERAG